MLVMSGIWTSIHILVSHVVMDQAGNIYQGNPLSSQLFPYMMQESNHLMVNIYLDTQTGHGQEMCSMMQRYRSNFWECQVFVVTKKSANLSVSSIFELHDGKTGSPYVGRTVSITWNIFCWSPFLWLCCCNKMILTHESYYQLFCILSRFDAAFSLYQGALSLTVRRRWQSGACL